MLAKALKTNVVLAHLSIKECMNVTDEGLSELLDVIKYYNMILFEINLDPDQFDEQIQSELIKSSRLNRAIQQDLKPKLIIHASHDEKHGEISP